MAACISRCQESKSFGVVETTRCPEPRVRLGVSAFRTWRVFSFAEVCLDRSGVDALTGSIALPRDLVLRRLFAGKTGVVDEPVGFERFIVHFVE